jgi:hypothetical protein
MKNSPLLVAFTIVPCAFPLRARISFPQTAQSVDEGASAGSQPDDPGPLRGGLASTSWTARNTSPWLGRLGEAY